MSKKAEKDGTATVAQPAGVEFRPEHVLATDEFAGKGGSYVFDPGTGTRTPAAGNDQGNVTEEAQ